MTQPALSDGQKEKFKYWLTNNQYINAKLADIIIDHVARYFPPISAPVEAAQGVEELAKEYADYEIGVYDSNDPEQVVINEEIENAFNYERKKCIDGFIAGYTAGQSSQKEGGDYVEGLKKLLRIADCPELLIENPFILNSGKPATEESKQWAAEVIERHKKLLVEKPIVVQMNEEEYESYKKFKSEPLKEKGEQL